MNINILKSIHHNTALDAIASRLAIVNPDDLTQSHTVIVPDRYTLSAEKTIYPKLLGGGSLNINITTLARIWQKIGDSRQYISKFGAVMLMQRAVESTSLAYFHSAAGYPGFCQMMYSVVCQLISQKITPDMLLDACQDLQDTTALKLRDIAKIYKAYNDLAGGKYIDSSGLSALLAQKTHTHTYFKSHFYIVGFDNLCKTELDLFAGIAQNAKSCTFAVASDSENTTTQALINVLPKCQITELDDNIPPVCAHIYSQIHRHHPQPLKNSLPHRYKLYAAASIADEVSHLAQSIVSDVESGLRLKDIAVIMPRPEHYSYALTKTLQKYNIPFYLPDEDTLIAHPIFCALTALSRAVLENCGFEDVLEFVKSAFFYHDREMCHVFENYCLKYGIDRTRFLQPFSLGEEQDKIDTAETIRIKFHNFYLQLQRAEKNKKVSQTFLYLAALLNEEEIDKIYTQALTDSGYAKQAQAAKQVFVKLEQLVSQILAIYPEADGNLQLFMTLLNVGAQVSKLSTVPVSADILLCGDLDSARYARIKKIYVLGAREGDFPPVSDDVPLITPSMGAQIDILEEFSRQSYAELVRRNHKIRVLLSQNSDFTIYCNLANNGALPEYITKLAAILNEPVGIATPQPLWQEDFKKDTLNVRLGMADKLFYRTGSTSISSIETYFSCPRKHFYRYGLRLKPRDVAELLSLDRGSFLHGAIELFVKQYSADSHAETLAEKCFDAMLQDDQFVRHLGSSRAESVFLKLRREVVRTCTEIARQIDCSLFVPQKQLLEASFGQGQQLPPLTLKLGDRTLTLNGKIDRIDIYQNGDTRYARIIDYKSGNSSYQEKNLYFGSKVQLFVYMAVLKGAGFTPAGLYYFPIHDNYVKDADKAYTLNGVTLAKRQILQATDTCIDIDSGISAPLGIKVKIQADGAIAESKSLLYRQTLDSYLNYAQEICRGAAAEILSGVNMLTPAKNACDYCEYTAVCSFYRQEAALKRSHAAGRDVRRRITENSQG